ncbi:MAG: site-specific DNA-methyltransferase, partial [Anaerolineae bacterium]|nr:site-specific DNA-methyltransferase [Anaerolineae bacterium]
MKLTDNEKREILNHLEKDRPLPDKYRFLLFDDKREVELIWNGKSNEVTNIVLPFQVIEQVDEPRAEKLADTALQLDLFDTRGRQKSGWTNKLIWGDNKLILSSLKNGAMSEEIEKNGGIKLIYIDPPFDVGADFSMDIEIGDETFTKRPNVLEELAYRDTWGKGADSFIAMIYERLILMRDLLADDGSIYVHCDYRVNNYLRLVLDEIFGKSGFKNEIIWYYETYQGAVKTYYPRKHDVIFFYTKSNNYKFDLQYIGNPEDSINFKRWEDYIVDGNKIKGSNYPKTDSRFTIRLDKWIRDNGRNPNDDDVIFEIKTMAANSVWRDIKPIDPKDLSKKIDYPTQKPEPLIERIINASTNENDIVADFFAGSGTTLAVAEKLNRKWIGSDLGKFAVHTTRKRMIGVQRELKAAGKDFRAFEILNLGKYERAHYIGYTPVASLLRNDKESVISTEGRNPDPAQKDFSVASLLRNDKESVISTEGRNPDPAQKDFSVASL